MAEVTLPLSLSISEDRGMAIPAGYLIKTAYVDIHRVKLACKERMSVGDVNTAYQKRLQCGANQPFPCPNGYWCPDEEGFFVIRDGRHEYISTVMLGFRTILVAWCEEAE